MTQAANLAALGSNANSTGILPIAGGGTAGTNGAIGFKNRIINGAMMIDQRNAGASLALTGALYCLDRWQTQAAAASKLTAQQSSVAPTGFVNSLLFTVVGTASLGSTDTYRLIQKIEGLNCADLMWGTANAQTVTMSFWVRSSVTGSYGASVQNSNNDRSYPFSYTISAANTWEQKTVTIPGDTSGTWLTTNGVGLYFMWGLGVGSSLSGTAGAWTAGDYRSVTGATSLVATNGATFYITGVQLEVGTAATNFDFRSYGTELALCQRYYWKIAGDNSDYPSVGSGVIQSSTSARVHIKHPVSMRTYPTFSYGGTLNIDHGGFFQTPVTSINGAYEGLDTSMLDLGASGGGLTTGRGAVVYCNNASTNFLQASAEL